tara:strand:- start:1027 stop:1239 length:213 start_codon:yes stop_codon:yes gene_type:complete
MNNTKLNEILSGVLNESIKRDLIKRPKMIEEKEYEVKVSACYTILAESQEAANSFVLSNININDLGIDNE